MGTGALATPAAFRRLYASASRRNSCYSQPSFSYRLGSQKYPSKIEAFFGIVVGAGILQAGCRSCPETNKTAIPGHVLVLIVNFNVQLRFYNCFLYD